MKNVVYGFILAGVAGGLITGCGNQSPNPIKDYKLNTVPENGKVMGTQSVLRSPLQVSVVGDSDLNFANFTEGQKGQIRFNVRILDPHVTETVLVPVTLPAGAQFTRATDNPNQWILSWTPSTGIVDPNRTFVRVPVQVEARVTKTTDPRLNSMIEQSRSFEIVVTRTTELPVIKGVSGLPASVEEGVSIPFSIEVKDPANMVAQPTLVRYPYDVSNNLEFYKADGSGFVFPNPTNPVQPSGNGQWKYNFVFDTANRELPFPLDRQGKPNPKADGLDVCFNVKALSPSGNNSAERPVCVKIKYAAQAPDVTFEDPSAQTQVSTGNPAVIKFTVTSPNGRGSVDLENVTSNFAKWSGRPTFKCDALVEGNESARSCQIEWQVPCNATVGKRTLSFKAVGKIGNKVRSKNITRDVIVSSNPDTCKPEPKAPQKTGVSK